MEQNSENTKDKAVILLLKKYEEGRQKNARWSQRAFAVRLGLSSGALSEIFQGKRILSSLLKKKIAAKLQLSPLEESEFFADELPEHLKSHRLEYYKLSNDQFHLISDWWHFAILNLLQTRDFKANVPWISKRLGLSEKVVQEAWDRLFRLGHLAKDGKKIVRTFPRIETSDNLFDLSIQKSHLEDLELIERSLREVPVELRDHTSMTLVMNRKSITKAKELIRIFQDRFSEEVEPTPSSPGEEVYKISISLFPLTQLSENK
jgi:uncharacterized protein (TIGR02147 family)